MSKINELNAITTGIDIPASNSDGLATKVNVADLLALDLTSDQMSNIKNTIGLDDVSNFSLATDYAVGDSVFYNNLLYRCTTAKSAGSVWDASYFEPYTIWTDVKPVLDLLEKYDPTKAYEFGDRFLTDKVKLEDGREVTKIKGNTVVWNLLNKYPQLDRGFAVSNATLSDNLVKSSDVGVALIDSVKGKTLVWNLLVQNPNLTSTSYVKAYSSSATLSVSSNVAAITYTTVTESAYKYAIYHTLAVNSNSTHKYFVTCDVKTSHTGSFSIEVGSGGNNHFDVTANVWTTLSTITTGGSDANLPCLIVYPNSLSSYSANDIVYYRRFNLIDLTQMFGSGNEPSTVEEFKKLFPEDYYPYNAGELVSFNGESLNNYLEPVLYWNLGTTPRNFAFDDNGYVTFNGTCATIDFNYKKESEITNKIVIGHKYLVKRNWNLSSIENCGFLSWFSFSMFNLKFPISTDSLVGEDIRIITCNYLRPGYIDFMDSSGKGLSNASGISGLFRQQSFDLTDMFGEGNEPTVEEFTALFPEDYYEYNEGEILNYNLETPKQDTVSFNISDIKDSSGNQLFPYGLLSAGTVYDEIQGNNAIKRIGVVDLGTLSWIYTTTNSGLYVLRTSSITDMNYGTKSNLSNVGNLSTIKYTTSNYTTIASSERLNNIMACYYTGSNEKIFYINDTSYTDATTFKSAMSGVLLYYELATPTIVQLDQDLSFNYYNSGTEYVTYPEQDVNIPLYANIKYNYNLSDEVTSEPFLNQTIPITGDDTISGIAYDLENLYSSNKYLVKVDVDGDVTLTNDTNTVTHTGNWGTLYLESTGKSRFKLIGTDFKVRNFGVYDLTRLDCTKELFINWYLDKPIDYNEGELMNLDLGDWLHLIDEWFPDGLKSAGSVYDEVTPDGAVKRIGSVDLGSLDWSYRTDYSVFSLDTSKNKLLGTSNGNLQCSKYIGSNKNAKILNNLEISDLTLYSYNDLILKNNSSYDSTILKESLVNTILYYELAEPITYTFDTPLSFKFDYKQNTRLTNNIESKSCEGYIDKETVVSVTKPIDKQIEHKTEEVNYRVTTNELSLGYNDVLRGKSIKGLSLVWNLLVKDGNFEDGENNWRTYDSTTLSICTSLTFANNTATITLIDDINSKYLCGFLSKTRIKLIKLHINLFIFNVYSSKDTNFIGEAVRLHNKVAATKVSANIWTRCNIIDTYKEYVSSSLTDESEFIIYPYEIFAKGDSYSIKEMQYFDLTLMFGAGNEPATADEFAQRLGYASIDDLPYFEYCEPTLKSIPNSFNLITEDLTIPITTSTDRLASVKEVYDEVTDKEVIQRVGRRNAEVGDEDCNGVITDLQYTSGYIDADLVDYFTDIPYSTLPVLNDGTSSYSNEYMLYGLLGNTIVLNLLWNKDKVPSYTVDDFTLTNNGDGSYTANGTGNGTYMLNSSYFAYTQMYKSHWYIFLTDITDSNLLILLINLNGAIAYHFSSSNTIRLITSSDFNTPYEFHFTGTFDNVTFYPKLIDLTQMFGSDSNIYSALGVTDLSTTDNINTAIANFKRMFPEDYYEYDTGSFKSIETLKLTGEEGNLLNLSGRTEVIYTSTPTDSKTFTESDIINGITSDGSFKGQATANLIHYTIKNNTLEIIAGVSGHGIGLPIKCSPSTSYYIKTAGYTLRLAYYDNTKTYISLSTAITNSTITTPDTCEWMIVCFIPLTNATYLYWKNPTIKLSDDNNKTIIPETTLIDVKSLTDSDGNVIFPDGLRKAGDVCDEIIGNKCIKRLEKVDLGSLTWSVYSSSTNVFSTVLSKMKTGQTAVNVISTKYNYGGSVTNTPSDKCLSKSIDKLLGTTTLLIRDSSYSTTSTLKTALSGVYVYYQLATPIEYTIDYDHYTLNANTKVFTDLDTNITVCEKQAYKNVIANLQPITYNLSNSVYNYYTLNSTNEYLSNKGATLSEGLLVRINSAVETTNRVFYEIRYYSNLDTALTDYPLHTPIRTLHNNYLINSKYLLNSDNLVREETTIKSDVELLPINITLTKSVPIIKEYSYDDVDIYEDDDTCDQDFAELIQLDRECLIAVNKDGSKTYNFDAKAQQFNGNENLDYVYGTTSGCAELFKDFTGDVSKIRLSGTIYSNQFNGSSIDKIDVSDITTVLSNAFINCNNLDYLYLPKLEVLNSSITTNYTMKRMYFSNLKIINASGLAIRPLYIIIDLTTIPTLNSSSNTTNNYFPIYVPDDKVEDYSSATTWSTIYSQNRIKGLSLFNLDYPEDTEKWESISLESNFKLGGYPLEVIPQGIKSPLILTTTTAAKWYGTALTGTKRNIVVDTTKDTLYVEATSVIDPYVKATRTFTIVEDSEYITLLKSTYPSYSDLIETYQLDLIEDPNKVEVLTIASTITIDLTGDISDPTQMVTGDIGLNDTDNVINWIRRNSHTYIGNLNDDVLDLQLLCDWDRTRLNNGRKSDITTLGNDVFMKLPKFYYKCTESETDKWNISFRVIPTDDTWIEWDGKHFIGAYEAYVNDSKMYSASNVTPSVNTSWTTFKKGANARGNNYSMVTFESHSIMGILFYAYYGNTHCQSLCGSGTGTYPKVTGKKDYAGMHDSNLIRGNYESINYWGLENWWGDVYEIIDNVRTDAPETIDDVQYRKFSTYEPSNLTTFTGRTVKNTYKTLCQGGDYSINKIDFSNGELAPTDLYRDKSSFSMFYCDYGNMYAGAGLVARRSCVSSYSDGGVAYLYVNDGVGNSNSNIGSRLEYSGDYNLLK